MLDECVAKKINVSLELTKNKSDYVVCLSDDRQTKYVLSKYDPKRETKKILEGKIKNKEVIFIVLGFGAGYVVEEIKSKIGNQGKIIIVDPDKESVQEQLKLRNLENKLMSENIIFFTGQSISDYEILLNEQVQVIDVFNTEVIPHQEYLTFYNEYFKEIVGVTVQHLRKLEMIKNTINKYCEIHINNFLKNLPHILSGEELKELKDTYKDVPAVIVSAGPSLSKNIDQLKDFKGLILAMGRTLKPLKDRGIEPHFLASIDPSEGIVSTFQGEMENNCPLITTPISNHEVIKRHKGEVYFVGSEEEENLAEQLGVEDRVKELPIGGSVANTLCSVAYYMGCNPIVFVGQDLAYTDGKLHDSNTLQNKVATEESHYRYIDGYYGDKVKSYPDLIIFRKWFEEFIEMQSDRTYINATEGGAAIKGTIPMNLNEVVQKYKSDNIISILKQDYVNNASEIIKNRILRIKDMLEIAKNSANQGKELSNQLREEYEVYEGKRVEKIRVIIERLNQDIDKKIKNQKELGIAKQIFESISLEIETGLKYRTPLQETVIEEGIRVANNSYELYDTLETAFEKTIKIINEQKEVLGWN